MIDRVFSGDCSTRTVYEEEAKEIALSVVRGMNCKCNGFFFFFLFLCVYWAFRLLPTRD